MRPVILAGLAALACGGTSIAGGPVEPATSASQAMTTFMRAASDSNLAIMSELCGSADGPSARSGQPPEWERWVIMTQDYLRGDSSREETDGPVSGSGSPLGGIVL